MSVLDEIVSGGQLTSRSFQQYNHDMPIWSFYHHVIYRWKALELSCPMVVGWIASGLRCYFCHNIPHANISRNIMEYNIDKEEEIIHPEPKGQLKPSH